jgi:hypothetical protein
METRVRWQLAIAQHPMYLIIREDEEAAERIPPWGAPTIGLYIERIERNLEALREHAGLKLGFEWSGAELDLLAEDSPDTLRRLRSLAQGARLAFYNGTYAQPHLHVLSSEANYRQFEVGQRAYRERLGIRVDTYAHQEVSVHDQVPQLLRAFGFKSATVPGFLSTLTWLQGGYVTLHGVRGPRMVNGRELTLWQGLDGSRVPLLLHHPIPRDRSFRETLVHETVIGTLGVPRLLIDMPDMIEIDEGWLAERSDVEFVLLGEAVGQRLADAPPTGLARLTTSWSYLEGIQAEALSRSIQLAEAALLASDAAQAVAMVVSARSPDSLDGLWQRVLLSQHHDVFCFSAPGLRRRALDWLADVRERAASVGLQSAVTVAAEVAGASKGDVLVLGVTPHPVRAVVQAELPPEKDAALPCLIDADDQPVAAELDVSPRGYRQLRFVADIAGLGYRTYRRASGDSTQLLSKPEAIHGALEYENAWYRAAIGEDGTFHYLGAVGGQDMLDSERGHANRLSATDSAALRTYDESDEGRRARLAAAAPVRGPVLTWQPIEPATVRRGPLGVRFVARGKMSDRVGVDIEIDCYESLARIEIRHRFTFDDASLGTYFDDDSKLLLHWPLRSIESAVHDIPFGVVDAVHDQSFYPANWLDARVGGVGLLIMHSGTPRHWISANEVVRLLGWGEDTDAIGNRLGNWRWLKRFDQRLRGTHVVHSAVEVHPAAWGPHDLIAAARSFSTSPLTYVVDNEGSGRSPLELTLASLPPNGPHATSVRAEGGRVVMRVHAGPQPVPTRDLFASAPRPGIVRSLAGHRLSRLAPWQIAHVELHREVWLPESE